MGSKDVVRSGVRSWVSYGPSSGPRSGHRSGQDTGPDTGFYSIIPTYIDYRNSTTVVTYHGHRSGHRSGHSAVTGLYSIIPMYRISANSFCGNYYFLKVKNVEIFV